jgi:hypothetical protein
MLRRSLVSGSGRFKQLLKVMRPETDTRKGRSAAVAAGAGTGRLADS